MVNGLVMMFKVYFMDDKIVNCDEVYWRKMAVCVSFEIKFCFYKEIKNFSLEIQ